MPPIKAEYVGVVNLSLDLQDCVDLPYGSQQGINSIADIDIEFKAITTLPVSIGEWEDEEHSEVDECREVQNIAHPLHQLVLNSIQLLSIVLEPERLMLGVYEGLPDPYWEDDLLP